MYAHPPPCRFFPKGECKDGKYCKYGRFKPKHANAGTDSSDNSGNQTGDESEGKPSSKAKGKRKNKGAFVAKALFGLAGAAQVTVGQSMLYFASVASICDDTISYRTKTNHDCATNLAENYQEDDSLFYWDLPSWAGFIAGGNFQHRPAFGILRTKDQQSLTLKVKFPPAIIFEAIKTEKIEKCRGITGGTTTSPDTIQTKLVIKSNATR